MSRLSFDVTGLWESDPAPQSADRTVPVSPPPRPSRRTSQEQGPAYRARVSPTRLPQTTQRTEDPSGRKGRPAARATTVSVPPARSAWPSEPADGFVNPISWNGLMWSYPLVCVKVSTTGSGYTARTSGWSVEVGLASLPVPFLPWMGGDWAGQVRTARNFAVMAWGLLLGGGKRTAVDV